MCARVCQFEQRKMAEASCLILSVSVSVSVSASASAPLSLSFALINPSLQPPPTSHLSTVARQCPRLCPPHPSPSPPLASPHAAAHPLHSTPPRPHRHPLSPPAVVSALVLALVLELLSRPACGGAAAHRHRTQRAARAAVAFLSAARAVAVCSSVDHGDRPHH